MKPLEHAEFLLSKAEQDERALSILAASPLAPEEAIGFHAQQAVEKHLKAALAAAGIPYPRRHDLIELIDLLRNSGIAFPDDLDDVRWLNPFAVDVRYGDLPNEGDEPFNRSWAVDRVRQTRLWAESILHLKS